MNLSGINHFALGGGLHCFQSLLPPLLLKLLLFYVFRQGLIDYPSFAPVQPAGDCFQMLFNFRLKANCRDTHGHTLKFEDYNVLQHSQ
jgi:hypothetical protein